MLATRVLISFSCAAYCLYSSVPLGMSERISCKPFCSLLRTDSATVPPFFSVSITFCVSRSRLFSCLRLSSMTMFNSRCIFRLSSSLPRTERLRLSAALMAPFSSARLLFSISPRRIFRTTSSRAVAPFISSRIADSKPLASLVAALRRSATLNSTPVESFIVLMPLSSAACISFTVRRALSALLRSDSRATLAPFASARN